MSILALKWADDEELRVVLFINYKATSDSILSRSELHSND